MALPSKKSHKTDLGTLTLALTAAALLAACGSGDGSSDPVTPVPVVPAALTLSGTAATGAALANRPVDAKCAAGTAAPVNTGADGKYTVTITGGALPCVLRVTAADGSVLHSLATGSGATAAANITPASELVVAHLVGGPAAGAYGSFDAASITDAKVQAALTAVGDMLKAGGVDVTAIGNLLTAPLVAANGSTAGNDFDKALDALKAKLAATGTTLATLADGVAKASPNLPASSVSTTPSLPAAMMLQPKAANCNALRSGRYRVVVNAVGGNAPDTELVTMDAVTLAVTNADGSVTQLTANGNCRYRTLASGDVVVSAAGVIVAQVDNGAPPGTPLSGALIFPEQTHPLAGLAGDWNLIGLDRTEDNGPIHLTAATATLNATGQITAFTQCDNVVDGCSSGTAADVANLKVTANPTGGFDFTNTSNTPVDVDRLFAYRSGGGELVWVLLSKNGHIQFATRKVALTLPAVGRVSESFNLTLTPQYTAPFAISDSKNTIVSVDATANTFLRDAVTNLTTGVTRPERFAINQPREGYSLRTGEAVVDSAGQPSTVTSFVAMTLRGTGVVPVALLANNQLVLSVSKP